MRSWDWITRDARPESGLGGVTISNGSVGDINFRWARSLRRGSSGGVASVWTLGTAAASFGGLVVSKKEEEGRSWVLEAGKLTNRWYGVSVGSNC